MAASQEAPRVGRIVPVIVIINKESKTIGTIKLSGQSWNVGHIVKEELCDVESDESVVVRPSSGSRYSFQMFEPTVARNLRSTGSSRPEIQEVETIGSRKGLIVKQQVETPGYTVRVQENERSPGAAMRILQDPQLLQMYGTLNEETKYKMLLLCRKKSKREDHQQYGEHLKKSCEAFIGENLSIGRLSYKGLCREVVRQVPADDWMQFVHLHLNLSDGEIERFRRKYCVFSDEQIRQILEDQNGE